VDGANVTPWCVPTSGGQDLEFARKLISGAQEGILFLFFNPGTFQEDPQRQTLLQNILSRHHEGEPDYNPNLYICGVVNQDIPMLTKAGGATKGQKPPAKALDPSASETPVALFRNGNEPPARLSHDVLVPHNVKTQFHEWEKELLGASMVNIHSKVIVIDPFGAKPVVMTGSHNLGYKASHANDDNLMIIEGNAPLAAAYAINIIAIYQTYRWNSYVEAHRADPAHVWHGLVDSDTWQTGYLSGQQLHELEFWTSSQPEAAPAAAAAATGSGIHTTTASVHGTPPVHKVRGTTTHAKTEHAAAHEAPRPATRKTVGKH